MIDRVARLSGTPSDPPPVSLAPLSCLPGATRRSGHHSLQQGAGGRAANHSRPADRWGLAAGVKVEEKEEWNHVHPPTYLPASRPAGRPCLLPALHSVAALPLSPSGSRVLPGAETDCAASACGVQIPGDVGKVGEPRLSTSGQHQGFRMQLPGHRSYRREPPTHHPPPRHPPTLG